MRLSPEELAALAQLVAPLVVAQLRDRGRIGESPEPQYLGVEAAAALAGVTASTVYRWCAQGRLPRHGTPGRLLVDRAELEALLRAPAPRSGKYAALSRGSQLHRGTK
jgi:excisionase family DNA binding protein